MFNDYIKPLKYNNISQTKKLRKLGTLAIGVVETTPIVWQDRLLRFEWIRSSSWGKRHNSQRELGYYHFVDMETEEEVGKPFAFGNAFGCAYEENGVMYAHGVGGNGAPEGCNYIDVYYSTDLCEWKTQRAITLPEHLHIFNTSVCKDADGYIMAIEVDGPPEIIGEHFTVLFARSKDLLDWTLMPIDKYIFYKERYSACPSIRYFDGMYYIVYLEGLPFYRWTPYIVRSRDLIEFEVALLNPFMLFGDEDRQVIHPERFSAEEFDSIKTSPNGNNSDVDFCEYHGKTYITYSWGNQLGNEFLALARYDGSLEEFLRSYF